MIYKREKVPDNFDNKNISLLSRRILRYANRGVTRLKFLRKISDLLLKFSNCDKVELLMKDKDLYYRWIKNSNSYDRYDFQILGQKEISIIKSTTDENISTLDKLCRNILNSTFDSSLDFFTNSGSFWSGDIDLYLHDNETGIKTNTLISTDNYKSISIIHVEIDDFNDGLLELMSKEPYFFTKNEIILYENIGRILGIAIANRRAQSSLRERIKELACLYQISQITEKPGISLDEILQKITLLLPSALQYSDIAAAKITFDEKLFSTPGFGNALFSISSQIIINGQNRGIVNVAYTKGITEFYKNPFLVEEKKLLESVAREISMLVNRKQIEEDRKKIEEQLRHADRLATLGQLAAGVAHELNEPLGSILGFAQLSKKIHGLPNQVSEDLTKIENASIHAREVVKKLLFFARQMPIKIASVNINKIIEDGIYFLESRCIKEGIELIRSLAPNLPNVLADPAQIHQVLVNLIVNAIQAMPDGGILTIKTDVSDDFLILIVEDTGLGMTDKVREKIFLPFFTTKDVNEGTGLGLSVVHGIISSLGGNISVESEVNSGSSFKILLPLNDQI